MGFLNNIFKKKSNVDSILNLMTNFANDVKSLKLFEENATAYFGTNWKFNLEIFLNSMEKADRDKYLPIFKNILRFERALGLWAEAVKITKDTQPINSDTIKNLPEFKENLPLFGVEGERLLSKLLNKLGLGKEIKHSPISVEKILHKVSNEDLEKGVFKKDNFSQSHSLSVQDVGNIENNIIDEEIKNPTVETLNIIEQPKPQEQIASQKKQSKKNTAKQSDDVLWRISNFKKVSDFIPHLREAMSAISIFKSAPSIEEYRDYGFLIDTLEYLIKSGDDIIATSTDDEILSQFEGGRDTIVSLVTTYKSEIKQEIIIPKAKIKNISSEKKEYNVNFE